jgi:hypothetical protein
VPTTVYLKPASGCALLALMALVGCGGGVRGASATSSPPASTSSSSASQTSLIHKTPATATPDLDARQLCRLLSLGKVSQLVPGAGTNLQAAPADVTLGAVHNASCDYREPGAFGRIWLSVTLATAPNGVPATFKGSSPPAHTLSISGDSSAYTSGESGSGAELLTQVGGATLSVKPYPTAAPDNGSPATNGGEAPKQYEEVAIDVTAQLLLRLG